MSDNGIYCSIIYIGNIYKKNTNTCLSITNKIFQARTIRFFRHNPNLFSLYTLYFRLSKKINQRKYAEQKYFDTDSQVEDLFLNVFFSSVKFFYDWTTLEKNTSGIRETSVARNNEGPNKVPLKPLNAIERCNVAEGFQGGLLSESYTSDRCFFFLVQEFMTIYEMFL